MLIFLLILKVLQEGDSRSDLMVYLLLDALVYSANTFTTISHNQPNQQALKLNVNYRLSLLTEVL